MAGFLTYGLQHARFAFPEHSSSGINNELPAANSCGHSRGIQHSAFTAFPFTPLSGHHRTLKLRGYLKLCKNHPDCDALTVSAQPRIDRKTSSPTGESGAVRLWAVAEAL